MANRFRALIESVVFAGMKPGDKPVDPLYLTNQTFAQKSRRILMIGAPILVVFVLTTIAILVYRPKSPKVLREISAAEVAAKTLPAFNKKITLDSNKDLEVMEVHFEHTSGNFMAGNFKNVSGHSLGQVVVVFDLMDENRSQLGGVTVTETDLGVDTVRAFKIAIEQTSAMYALVREVRTQ